MNTPWEGKRFLAVLLGEERAEQIFETIGAHDQGGLLAIRQLVFHADEHILQDMELTDEEVSKIMITRKAMTTPLSYKEVINHVHEAVEWFVNMHSEPKEVFEALLLTHNNVPIRKVRLGEGSHNKTIVDVDRLVRDCVLYKAKKVIISHNHPSGETEPSVTDEQCTININQRLKSHEVVLMDHLIFAAGVVVSLQQLKPSLFK